MLLEIILVMINLSVPTRILQTQVLNFFVERTGVSLEQFLQDLVNVVANRVQVSFLQIFKVGRHLLLSGLPQHF